MRYRGVAFLWALLFLIERARCYMDPISIRNCPEGCTCNDIGCTNDDGKIECLEVEVFCVDANVAQQLDSVPKNVTRLSITGENMGHTDLDMFTRFKKLRKLGLKNNGIRSLKLTKKMKYLDFLNLDQNRICFLPRKNMTLLPRLNMLRARFNNLTHIHENRFPRRMTYLDLSHNHIQSPRKGSFRRLKLLEVLKLENNSITEINAWTFRFTSNLQTLILDHNDISALNPDTFKLLPYITFVSLRYNFISTIDRYAFKQLGVKQHWLHEIHLEHNMMTEMPAETVELFMPRAPIYALYLMGNPLACDCSTISVRDSAGTMLRDIDRATCASPPEAVGITLAEVRVDGCDNDDEDFYYDFYDDYEY